MKKTVQKDVWSVMKECFVTCMFFCLGFISFENCAFFLFGVDQLCELHVFQLIT